MNVGPLRMLEMPGYQWRTSGMKNALASLGRILIANARLSADQTRSERMRVSGGRGAAGDWFSLEDRRVAEHRAELGLQHQQCTVVNGQKYLSDVGALYQSEPRQSHLLQPV